MIYTLTESGRSHFHALLRETLLSYELVHTGMETAIVFLSYLTENEGIALLRRRRQAIQQRREQIARDIGQPNKNTPLVTIAGDHLISLIDAELAWIDRSLAYLHEVGWPHRAETDQTSHTPNKKCPGNQA